MSSHKNTLKGTRGHEKVKSNHSPTKPTKERGKSLSVDKKDTPEVDSDKVSSGTNSSGCVKCKGLNKIHYKLQQDVLKHLKECGKRENVRHWQR